jgi:hypothetical protein
MERNSRGNSTDSSADYSYAWFPAGTNHLIQALRINFADR